MVLNQPYVPHRRGLFFMLFWVNYYFVYMTVFSILFAGPLGTGVGFSIVSSLWFQMFFQITILLLPLAIWLAIFREKINEHLPHMRLGKTNLLYIVGLSIFIQPLFMVVAFAVNLVFPNETGEFVMQQANYPLWVMILVIAVTPAICEEVVFRGYIQSSFRNKTFWTMALMNGLFFGIMHFNAHQFFHTFLAGIFWAYMVYATRSIRAGVISHFIMNASQVSFIWFAIRLPIWLENLLDMTDEYELGIDYILDAVYDIDPVDPELLAAMIPVFIMFGLIATGSTIVAILLLRGFDAHNKKRVAEYEAKIAAESAEREDAEIEIKEAEITPEPEITPESSLKEKRKNLAIDVTIILAIVAVYVFIVFGIPLL
ncbi:MAG: CPBP family intramembrane metalloprotease [Defluviitaleaceae bacterium]|nr:CPBP family intramembrane metalloprotease [Defluviitaleaceae bacterium]